VQGGVACLFGLVCRWFFWGGAFNFGLSVEDFFMFFYLDIKEPKDQGCIVFMIQWDCVARKKYELVSINLVLIEPSDSILLFLKAKRLFVFRKALLTIIGCLINSMRPVLFFSFKVVWLVFLVWFEWQFTFFFFTIIALPHKLYDACPFFCAGIFLAFGFCNLFVFGVV